MLTPIDGDDTLLATEPDVQPPKVQVFPWEKLVRGPSLVVVDLAFSSVKGLMKELSKSIYTFITRGEYPMWYDDRRDLVEHGIARFMGEGPEVTVKEPIALMRASRLDQVPRYHGKTPMGMSGGQSPLSPSPPTTRDSPIPLSLHRFHGSFNSYLIFYCWCSFNTFWVSRKRLFWFH
jgi:hypothetical protein